MRKWKWKKPITLITFEFSLPSSPFGFPCWVFKELVLRSTHFPLFQTNRSGSLETMCVHLKIYEIISDSFCVFPLEHFDVFECFYSCWLCSNMVFCKDHFVMTTLLWPNKTKGRQYIPFYHREYQSKPKTSKELLSFWEDNISGWFTHIGYKKTQFRIRYVLHAIILCIIYTYMIGMKVLLRNKLNDFCTDTLFYCFQVLSVKSFVSIWVKELKYFV